MARKLSLSLAIAALTAHLISPACVAETTGTVPTPGSGTASSSSTTTIPHKPAVASAKASNPGSNPTARTTKPRGTPSAKAGGKEPASAKAESVKPPAKKRAEVLDPNQFFGMAMIGYAAAKQAPEVMENLFCYCGCDLTDSHISLLDCFTSIHGVDCHICQEEAQIALKMHKQGDSMVKIQRRIDEEFAKQYPFEEDTPTYKKYKANRLWVKGGPANNQPASTGLGPDPKNPKLKPGAKAGNCCAGDKHGKGK